MNVLITGDRTMAAVYGPLVAIEMLRAVAAGATILTGTTERGVDAIVTEFGAKSGVEVTATDDVPADALVVYVHADPHTSSRLKPFLAAGDDAVRIVTPADLLV